ARPLGSYASLRGFEDANDAFIACAVPLGGQAIGDALDAAGLQPSAVDLVISTTITGLAVPSLDARIGPRIGLRADVKRVPIVGLGCVAGAAGLARVHDYLAGNPDHVAVLVSVELCSLTAQPDDASMANLVASGLFGDGAAAVVAVGAEHPLAQQPYAEDQPHAEGGGPYADCGRPASRPRIIATRSRLYPGTERAMGWDIGSTGFRIVLGAEVPDLVLAHLGEDVDGFLAEHGLRRDDIGWWVCHPGGPKVLHAIQDALGLDRQDVSMTWDSLERIGNLSSASVLHILADTLDWRP